MHAIFHAKSNLVDTLVADFDMPDINGVQLASAFLEINPVTRIIIMSGRLIDRRILLSD
jgi:YesN/AraC family two-component response regulator